MKKKYTVVYCGPRLDNYNTRETKFKHLETDDLVLTVENDNDIGGWTAVWFIFDGHCQQTLD
jgi:hypothetical protein